MHVDTILCAIDFAPAGELVLRAGLDLAGQLDASVHVVHVAQATGMATGVDPLHGQVIAHEVSRVIDAAQARLDRLLEQTETGDVELTGEIRVGDPVPALVDAAWKRSAGLIVIGTRGRTGIARLLDGNTAEALVRETPIPVLCIPVPEEATA